MKKFINPIKSNSSRDFFVQLSPRWRYLLITLFFILFYSNICKLFQVTDFKGYSDAYQFGYQFGLSIKTLMFGSLVYLLFITKSKNL
jgi:hypothetical protein